MSSTVSYCRDCGGAGKIYVPDPFKPNRSCVGCKGTGRQVSLDPMRFSRGLSSIPSPEYTVYEPIVDDKCERVCVDCGGFCWKSIEEESPQCTHCWSRSLARPGVYMSVSAEGEDSKNPQRVREGTSQYNIGLRGIDTVVGTRPDGTAKLDYRPITNNELPTAKARTEYAKRTGCTPEHESVKRAIGGR